MGVMKEQKEERESGREKESEQEIPGVEQPLMC